MNRVKKYFILQLKRVAKVFPVIMLTTAILAVSLGLLVVVITGLNGKDDQKQKVNVGVVGDMNESYLGIGIYALQNLDSSRYSVSFLEMTEKEAKEQLDNGTISLYVMVPEGFVNSIVNGENLKLTYVTTNGNRGIKSILMDEMATGVSSMITESQSGIYGMQNILLEENMTENYYELTVELNKIYIEKIINRSDIFKTQVIGYSNQLSFISFFVCGMLVLFLLIWGINCSHLFIKKDMALVRVLASKKVPVYVQIMGEYIAYVVLMCSCFFSIAFLLIIGTEVMGISIPEWENVFFAGKIGFIIKLLPVLFMISALQFMLYEIITGFISGILLQFVAAVGLGYLSGCFYPLSFFPETIRWIGEILPTGIAVKYAGKCLLNEPAGWDIVALLGYSAVFLVIGALERNLKMRRG